MHATLSRYAYTLTEVQGRFEAGDLTLQTIERPWISGDRPGGKPFESCVPDGDYELVPFERSNGDQVLALYNPDLGVYLHKSDGEGRYAILIHVGNWSDDVVGCIAPGLGRSISNNRVMVTTSRAAMKKLSEVMPFDELHTLTIRNAGGTT